MEMNTHEYFAHCLRAGIIPVDAGDDAHEILLAAEAQSDGELAWWRIEDRPEIRARAKAKLAIGAHGGLRHQGAAYRACVKYAIEFSP